LLLCYTPNLVELELTEKHWERFSLDKLREAALSPTSTIFYGFPNLRHVKAAGVYSGSRWGDDALDMGVVTFFLLLPAIRSFAATGADHRCCHIFEDITHAQIRSPCPAGASSVEVMTLESCALPSFSLSNPIRACRALKSFTCRWARRPHWYRLRFEELGEILQCQKHTLERLVLAVEEVQYVDWDSSRDKDSVHIGDDHHKYAPIGSLDGSERLTYLEISGNMLVGSSEPPSLPELLPPNLETIRVLPPAQPHIELDLQHYASAKACERKMMPHCHVVERTCSSKLEHHDQKKLVGWRATKTVRSGCSSGPIRKSLTL